MSAVKRLMTGSFVPLGLDSNALIEYRDLTNNPPEGILAGNFFLLLSQY